MANNSNNFSKDTFAAPLGDFIASIGEGVGEAQAALDEASLRQTLEIYNEDPENADEKLKLLREIGYQPTFYTLPKTKAKAKISLSISQQNESVFKGGVPFRTKMYATPMNASNTNKYNLNLNASAEIEFEIVPVPPSDNQLIRILPNLIYKENPSDTNPNGIKRNYQEIKIILDNFGLEHNFGPNTDINLIEDTSVFSSQLPAYEPNKIIKINDLITLEL